MTDRTVVYRLEVEAKRAQAQMAAFGASVKKAADDTTAATKSGAEFRQGLDTLGGAAGKVGLVAAAGLGAAILKAADFDQAMSNVSAATMESASGMEALRKAALDAGASTVFSATEAAAGIEQLAKAGVETTDILNGGLTGALDLAAAGTIDVGVASEIAATTMNQFGLAGTEVSHIADVLSASAGKAQGEVTDMAAALKFVGPVAAQMGISLEETAGSIAYLATQGILGEQAGTSLRGMLTALTSPSKIAADEMSRLGISMYDAQGQFIGLDGLAGQLKGSMSNLGEAERDAALGRIFGNEQITAARILYAGGSEAIAKWTGEVDAQGFAADQAAKKLDNLKGDLEALGGAFETALIGTGDGSQGMLRGLTQGLTGATNAYNDLGDGAKSGVAVTLAATAALGGGLFVFSKMVTGIAATRVALTQLGATSATVGKALTSGGVVLALAGVAYGIREIAKASDESLPGLEALTGQLLSAAAAGNASALGAEYDSLGESIDRLSTSRLNIGWGQQVGEVFTGSAREATAEIEALDTALANIASTEGLDASEAAYQALADSMGLTVGQQVELNERLPQYREVIAGIQNENKAAAAATEDLVEVTDEFGNVAYKTAEQVKAETDALKDARKAAHETASSFVTLGESLNDSKQSLGQWLNEMQRTREAMENFTENARTAAKRGLDEGLIKSLAEAGPEGALRMKELADASEKELGRANREFRGTEGAVKDLAKLLLNIPQPKLKVDNGEAMSDIDALEAKLRSVADEDVFINVRRIGASTLGPRMEAAGGPIYGPGTATSDSIPAMLSDGEYVIRAAAVEKYGVNFFDTANSMRLAGGGSAGDKDKKERERREEAARRAEEKRQREEEKRQRALERKRVSDQLKSNLANEEQQANLTVQDAKRRLKSAQDAGRGGGEINELKLALKEAETARAEMQKRAAAELRADQQQAAAELIDIQTKAAEEATAAEAKAAEEARAHETSMFEAMVSGQEKAANQLISAAGTQLTAAESVRDSIKESMKQIGAAAISAFQSNPFASQGQQRGLSVSTGSGVGWLDALTNDIAGLAERNGLIGQLSGAGVSGTALSTLLESASNEDISSLIASGRLGEFQSLIAQREALQTSTSNAAGQAMYGTQFAAADAQVGTLTAQVAILTQQLEIITAQRPITVYEAHSAQATAAEVARLQAVSGVA